MIIDNFKLEKNIIKKLKDNDIDTVDKLKSLNRSYLKELGFDNNDINSIIINLQLLGFDLKKNKKNKLINMRSLFFILYITSWEI